MNSHGLKRALKRVRSIGTFWVARQTLSHLEAIRAHELQVVRNLLPPQGRLLEIGAGTGWQARELSQAGYAVDAIDLSSSSYTADRVWPITDYDGHRIPFPDRTFDVVFSSNVLEHIPHVAAFQREIHRVLKPGGRAIHVLPSSSWRFWTNVTHVLKNWTFPGVHGEHARNSIAEIGQFSRSVWLSHFSSTGWKAESLLGNGIFYTGCSILDSRLNLPRRRILSRTLGSACNVFVLRPVDGA